MYLFYTFSLQLFIPAILFSKSLRMQDVVFICMIIYYSRKGIKDKVKLEAYAVASLAGRGRFQTPPLEPEDSVIVGLPQYYLPQSPQVRIYRPYRRNDERLDGLQANYI